MLETFINMNKAFEDAGIRTTNGGGTMSKDDFLKHFIKTNKKVRYTFGGWDGHSYNGESRNGTIYKTDIKGFENEDFIVFRNSVHYVMYNDMIEDKVNGGEHPTVSWFVDVSNKM